jgi:CRP/FNR family transcriptional regulator, transcriptional activator FtrB
LPHFPRVLVVSPHPQIYGALQRLATAAHCRFDWAANASRLEELLANGLGFDAAVLDAASTAEANEIELADKMRRLLGCGIVVISDQVRHLAAANGWSRPYDVYLQKPVKPAELIAAAKRVCARRGRNRGGEAGTDSEPAAEDPNAARRAALATVEGFADLSEDVLGRLGSAAVIDQIPSETIIFRENSRPTHLHAVLDGQVALITTAERDSTVTEILGPGCPFVLAAVLADTPYIQAARTLARSKIIRIEAMQLRAEIRKDPRLFEAMIGWLSRHDRMLVRQLADLKLRSAAQRLGCFLLRLAREQESAANVNLPCSKALLAAHLGMAPEHLSRAFVTLRSCGVTTRGPVVALSDPQTLAGFARPDQESWG